MPAAYTTIDKANWPLEQSTCAIDVAFRDLSGAAITPSSAAWSLYDGSGTIVNSRSAVSISISGSTASVTLTNADLDITSAVDPQSQERIFHLSYVFSGNTYRHDLLFGVIPSVGT